MGIAGFSTAATWQTFADCLDGIRRNKGLSYAKMETVGRDLAQANPRLWPLRRSTANEALSGRRPIQKPILDSLMAVLALTAEERNSALAAWQRISDATVRGPANASRFDEASPRELGIHAAITVDGATGDLPAYVRRDFHDTVLSLIAQGAESGCFLLLVGSSSTGKTRSLFEAIRDVVPDWWLVQPTDTREIYELAGSPTGRTILWLDEFHWFLLQDPPLTRQIMVKLVRAGTIAVGTLWPEEYHAHKVLRASGHDPNRENRLILEFARHVMVRDRLSAQEYQLAVAETDPRIQLALQVADTGLTQVLAAGPDLVDRWEQAPDPYSRAIITVAADARRLGVHAPLPADLLRDAMAGYLSSSQRVSQPETWLQMGLHHATALLHGDVSALIPLAGPQSGELSGYVLADYLAQHIRRTRRGICPPDELWAALCAHIAGPNELRQLANTALTRLRFSTAERMLLRLQRLTGTVEPQLVDLFVQQDRFGEAMPLLDTWVADAAGDRQESARRSARRAEVLALQAGVEPLRSRAADDPAVAMDFAEMLYDGGRAADLRLAANAGDITAAEQLAELLMTRGSLEELRQLADSFRFAAEQLADLLAALGHIDELAQRARAGDGAAALRLSDVAGREARAEPNTSAVHAGVLSQLRRQADAGDEEAALELVGRLTYAHDIAALLAEVDAGTFRAAEQYLAVLNADPRVDQRLVRNLRAFGMDAAGAPACSDRLP